MVAELPLLLAATYYWSVILAGDYGGPFGILGKLRDFKIAGRWYWHGGLLRCSACLSIWVALISVHLLWEYGAWWVVTASAVAGVFVFVLRLEDSVYGVLKAYALWLNARTQNTIDQMGQK